MWQSSVRISHIETYGENASVMTIARQAMQGNYFGVIPCDSIFFFPEKHIRAKILAAYPEIAAVSIFRNDFSSISIKTDNRAPIARWCGSALATSSPASDCYLFDAKGFIFATTSTISPLNSFAVYEPLPQANAPIGLTLPNAEKLPAVFDFARQLSAFGSPVSKIVLRGDEIDDYVGSSTRVTYLLGDEQNAFTALASARANFNLADGSVEYVDLRFDGKIYLKKALGTRH